MENRYSLFLFLGTLFVILVSLLLIVAFIFVLPVLAKAGAASAESPQLVCQSWKPDPLRQIIPGDGILQNRSWDPGWRFMLSAGSGDQPSPDRELAWPARQIKKKPVLSNPDGALLESQPLH
jgi:hypothetical protein